jgi:hypothetical protein
MIMELAAFYDEFFQDVHGTADAEGMFAEDAFFELFCGHLVDAGELDTADRAQYLAPRGLRVDGYGGDPADSEGVLSLIIADFDQSAEVGTLTATEMDAAFKRLHRFVEKSLDPVFRNSLEETSPAFGLADLISTRWSGIGKIRMFLVSNRLLSGRVDGRAAGALQHVEVSYSVWDISRLHRYITSGHGREAVEINLAEFGGPVPGLPAHLDGAGYEAYLLVMPGEQLANIYDRWGARLLEQNVRCFLQARGNINKGIRNTIENNPEMFFAYNNGITATAESVEASLSPSGLQVKQLRNLQIVNGGQTTASIHAASRKKDVDLSRVFVQMKLSIIPPERSPEVVPKISEYANSQNRVNAADFFANHPFHVRIEDFSRRIFAPSPDGSFRQSKWFYERARGQYQDARAYLSAGDRRKFDLEYPKRQLFSKTDLAKYLNVWWGNPDIVSQGAQKNFAHFAGTIGREWAKRPDDFNEAFYRETIAKAVVFKAVERLVTQQPWYEGGYRANIVAYAIAKLAHDVAARGAAVNYEAIWKSQDISPAMSAAFTVMAGAVHNVIVDPPAGIRNVTEWAKKKGCWQQVQALNISLPTPFLKELLSKEEKRHSEKAAVKEQRLLNGIEAQMEVVRLGGEFWKSVLDWGRGRDSGGRVRNTWKDPHGKAEQQGDRDTESSAARRLPRWC